jgi:hypothetical protein
METTEKGKIVALGITLTAIISFLALLLVGDIMISTL